MKDISADGLTGIALKPLQAVVVVFPPNASGARFVLEYTDGTSVGFYPSVAPGGLRIVNGPEQVANCRVTGWSSASPGWAWIEDLSPWERESVAGCGHIVRAMPGMEPRACASCAR